MSYPDPKYVGDRGAVNAELRRADHAPEISRPDGGTVHYLAPGAEWLDEIRKSLPN